MTLWLEWWTWGIAAMLLAILEMVAPSYVFLGFAVGAGLVSLGLFVGGPVAALMPVTFPGLLVLFAVLSVVAWVAVRAAAGVRAGQRKVIRHDINED